LAVKELLAGLSFLLTGAFVYALNTEQHDPNLELTFRRLFGIDPLGSIETVAVLLGLGMFFLGLGAYKWLAEQVAVLPPDEEEPGESQPAPDHEHGRIESDS
jgi:hypothetical protein